MQTKQSKNQELGATLKRDDRGSIIVGRIMHGSAADKSGLLQPYDEVTNDCISNIDGHSCLGYYLFLTLVL